MQEEGGSVPRDVGAQLAGMLSSTEDPFAKNKMMVATVGLGL